MTGMVKRVVAERMQGKRPSPVRAIVAATVAGAAAAGLTYRVLRG
jgi:hypothetical protein